MLDLKVLQSALQQLEDEKGIPKEKVLEAIDLALAAAYKKEYAKKGQIIRAKMDGTTGVTEFWQVKKVVDESVLKSPEEGEEDSDLPAVAGAEEGDPNVIRKEVFNEEKHIMLQDAKKIRGDAKVLDELTFPLEEQDDFGRIAAQAAKQVIIQKIREAERTSILAQFAKQEGQIVGGRVQNIERGTVFLDLGKATGIIPREEQIPQERYRQGERMRAYLYQVEESPRGINLRLSRAHPQFIAKLFEIEAPEIASGAVVIESIAREPGSRSKIAVYSKESSIDPIGSCVGQRGVRVSTVINELGGEKIDIIEWSAAPETFIMNSLSPAKIDSIELDKENKAARVTVQSDQFSLAIGKGGQNVRLAAKLTGWKIDIIAPATAGEGATQNAVAEGEKAAEETAPVEPEVVAAE